jgi:signal peptidase II
MRSIVRKARVFWPLLLVVLLTDCATKSAAVESLSAEGPPHSVVGETVRFNLTYNDRGAMGLPLGPFAKEGLGVLGLVVAGFVFAWYRRAHPGDVLLAAATSLFIAGALGNAWGRIFSPLGVVDFIDLGLGSYRFWTFNVADIALTVSVGLLFILFVRDDRKEKARLLGRPV